MSVLSRDHCRVGSWGDVRVGGLRVANVKNRVAPELLTAFTDDMYRCRTASAADYYPESEPGEVVTVHEFVGAGGVVADRLDVLGFTPARVREFFSLPPLVAEQREAR